MASVRVLPDSVINLISAGEVVERPASIVKELLENALDAGATSIVVELEQGGRRSVTVRDDGTGMNRHDLLLSIQRHATSKIAGREDLDVLSTLGFRGEALPSIAAVTHFRMTTSDGSEAWELTADGGELRGVVPVARTRGTTVSASGLFFSQPVRRKFLRSQDTELTWVERFLTGCAFSRLDVAFRLLHGGREIFDLPAGTDLAGRMKLRFGLATSISPVISSGSSGEVSATITIFPDSRWNRKSHQYILVNGRQVQCGFVSAPLDRALAGPAGYPLLTCVVELPPSEVDVNVHPSKREVRFREPRRVREAVEEAISDLVVTRKTDIHFQDVHHRRGFVGSSGDHGRRSTGLSGEIFEAALMLQMPASPLYGGGEDHSAVPIVQVGRSYLVTATDTGIALIDQHAAHERILYETVLDSIRSDAGAGRQNLLLPETVKVDGEELEQLTEFDALLRKAGFEFHMEGDTLVLTAVPSGTFHGISALREILKSLSDPGSEDMPVQERVAAAAACAGAVKFGDQLAGAETKHLVDGLFATSDPFHCPHGRPTLIEISFQELEKRFGR